MCGQWSSEGYIKNNISPLNGHLKLNQWEKIVDEIARHKVRFILIRGGEPFLFPGIMDLIEYINGKGIFISIDSNGTVFEKYAARLAGITNMHITFSIDGPMPVHDSVRGFIGSFNKTRENIALLNRLEKERSNKISKSICFTISGFSYQGLGRMPDVARSMDIHSINIVPFYYYDSETGKLYEEEMEKIFDTQAYSWRGFHHEKSGIDIDIFKAELRRYLDSLNGIENFPYMPLSEKEYEVWFSGPLAQVGPQSCMNVERLIDIQPNGDVNFCVDFPDYCFGNVKENTIEEIWNSPKAEKFRIYRRENQLAVCRRCGAKYIAGLNE
jgi:radical SAM protein with 4Fe4S-binding SPASM domain